MKVLSLSLDKNILREDTDAQQRARNYGLVADKYTIIVPAAKVDQVKISDQVTVYTGGGGNKIGQLRQIYQLGKKILAGETYDLITVQDIYFLALVGYRLAKKFKLPLEIQVHGFEKYRGLRRLIADFVLPRATGWRTVSQRQKRELVEKFNLPAVKIAVIPILANSSDFLVIERQYRKKDQPIILSVSRLEPVKRVDWQIRAVAQVPNVILWIVGAGSEKTALEKLAVDLGVNERVKFWGWQENSRDFYRAADIFVLSSSSEGWGISVIEAAASGLPIVMTDVGCAGEFITDGYNGLVVPVADVPALAQALVRLVANVGLAEKLGRQARETAHQLPSREEILKHSAENWQKILATPK